jgi:hypothetical protein
MISCDPDDFRAQDPQESLCFISDLAIYRVFGIHYYVESLGIALFSKRFSDFLCFAHHDHVDIIQIALFSKRFSDLPCSGTHAFVGFLQIALFFQAI